jgi:hypothetical protein
VHGVDGVINDVGPDLIEFAAEEFIRRGCARSRAVRLPFFQFDQMVQAEALTMSTFCTGDCPVYS